MAAGDVFFRRIAITVDPNAPSDTVNQTAISDGAFPGATFDILTTQLVPDTGVSGTKQVLIIVARQT